MKSPISPVPSSSSSSSLSSFSAAANVSSSSSRSGKKSNNQHQQQSKKSNKQQQQQQQQQQHSNALDEYATLLNPNANKHQQQQQKVNISNNPRFKKSKSSLPNCVSSISIPSNLYLLNQQQHHKQQPEFSMYTLDNAPADFFPQQKPVLQYSHPSAYSVSSKAATSKQPSSRLSAIQTNHKGSYHSNLASTSTSNSSSAIYNQYLMPNTQNLLVPNLVDSADNEMLSSSTPGGASKSNASKNNNNILSAFLTSTMPSYYQKYKQNQALNKNNITNNSAKLYMIENSMQQQPVNQHPVKDESIDYERRKEDAINRIIHNERIKQIRQKINDYEMLKEYQATFSAPDTTNQPTAYNYLSNKKSARKQSAAISNNNNNNYSRNNNSKAINSYFSRAYGGSVNKSMAIPRNMQKFDEYKSKSLLGPIYQDEASLNGKEEKAEELGGGDEDEFDDDYFYSSAFSDGYSVDESESGIEDEDGPAHLRFYKFCNETAGGGGGESSSLFGLGFNLTSPQSTFQLKISIISAEVKNIVNVLKQV